MDTDASRVTTEEYLEPSPPALAGPVEMALRSKYSDDKTAARGRPHDSGVSSLGVPSMDRSSGDSATPLYPTSPRHTHLYEELPSQYVNSHYDPNGYEDMRSPQTPPRTSPSRPSATNSSAAPDTSCVSDGSLIPRGAPLQSQRSLAHTQSRTQLPTLDQLVPAQQGNHSGGSQQGNHSGGSQQGVHGHGPRRKRANPLYEAAVAAALADKPLPPPLCSCICFGVMLCMLGLVACLALLVLIIVGYIPCAGSRWEPPSGGVVSDNRTELELVWRRLDRLERQLSHLEASASKMNKTLDTQITQQVSGLKTRFTRDMDQLKQAVHEQLGNASALAGPRGPPGPAGPSGVGNLTTCSHRAIQYGTSDQTDLTQTAWWPHADQDVMSRVLMGVECSTNVGLYSSFLRVQAHPDYAGVTQFSCVCRGSDDTSNVRYCHMHLWTCPSIS